MTNLDSTQTVNERVALRRGWTQQDVTPFGTLWFAPGCVAFNSMTGNVRPPDSCGTWKHAGPLLEEMVDAGRLRTTGYSILRSKPYENCKYRFSLLSDGKGIDVVGDAVTEAITRAWDAWQEGEDGRFAGRFCDE